MKQWWTKWSERIDAMALRERAFVFFAAAMVLIFLFQMLVSNPVTAKQREVSRQISQKQAEMRKVQNETQMLAAQQAHDPDAERRKQVEALKARIAELDTLLNEKQRELLPPERVPALLEEMLRRERRLELVNLHSLPPVALIESEKNAGPAQNILATQVYRHGVELTVRGSYFDLARYLAELEALPVRLFWGSIEVSGDDYPVITMRLSVYTLSLERTWVVV